MTADLLLCIEVEEHWDEDLKIIFERVNQSKSMEELLKHFKDLTAAIKLCGFNEDYTRKLLTIYFETKVKHPVKNSIQAFFNQLKNENATRIFNAELQKQIESARTLPLENRHLLVSCINEMSQNFRLAEVSIGNEADLLLDFLTTMLRDYIESLRTELSPAQKNEISHRLHNCLQATIFCVKSHLSAKKNNKRVTILVGEGAEICEKLLESNDVSQETRYICAILIVTNNTKMLKCDSHLAIILDEGASSMKRVCLMSGVLTVQQDLQIESLDDFTKILETIYRKNSIDNAIVYAVSRLLTLITKKLTQMNPSATSTHLQSIAKLTVSIAFLNLEHHVESVRYLARDSLKNLIDIGMKIDSEESSMIDEIFSATASLSSVSSQVIVINAISSSLPVAEVLQRMPNLQSLLLSSISANKENKMNCYEGLSSKHQRENSFGDWQKCFIEPIIEKIKSKHNSEEEYALLKSLLLKCVRKNKHALKAVVSSSRDFDTGFHLLCLSVAKMEGALDNTPSNEHTWRDAIAFDDLKKYMANIDADIRLAALQLIVDTKKSTEYFSKEEIECILYFFDMNVNVQSPSIRQSILGMIKKLFVRLSSVLQFLTKQNQTEILGIHMNMLKRFHQKGVDNLADGSNFSRRSLSLNILLNVLVTMREFSPKEIAEMWGANEFARLFNIFWDTFETNKEIAMEIMLLLPSTTIVAHSQLSLESLERLMSSIKPADSLTAAYLLQFALHFSLLPAKCLATDNEESAKYPEAYALLIWCEKLLLTALAIGEKSIIVAAGSNHMYGCLLCIRYIITKLDLCDLRACSIWGRFFARLISTCKRLSHIVGPIVNDSSPEGCLPEEDWTAATLDSDEGASFGKIIANTTPQMVLLCAWRTIREVSLLLGDLSTRAPLSVDQMMEIGDHFTELLTNIKHRGAFEQSFFGFSQFAVALRMSDCATLHNLPEKMLRHIIDSVSGVSDNEFMQIKNLCATRRSAGLPYIIQALLVSEIKISRAENFHFVMGRLIKFARFGEQMETRIHSLNILRALFRCKEFNDVIGEYISDALQTSLLGYGAHSWAERNSSTLLFSALMIRIFGVQRNKNSDDISAKNRMCGRVFFHRYPELYEFFMALLIEAGEHVRRQRMNSKLHPLMLLLNRLHTSISAESSEAGFGLAAFIAPVTTCSSCVEFQTRVLCAKFIANVIQPCHLVARINENISVLGESAKGNFKHARILEIFHLVKSASVDAARVNDFVRVFNEILSMLGNYKDEAICFGSLLDVLIAIFEKIYHHLPAIDMDGLESCLRFNETAYFGLPLLQSKIAAINLMRGEVEFALTIDASMNSCELLERLNCLLLLLMNDGDSSEIADEYEIDANVRFFADKLPTSQRQAMRLKVESDDRLISELRKIANDNDANLAARSHEILSNVNEKIDREHFHALINGIERKPEVMRKSILKCVNAYIRRESKTIGDTDWSFLLPLLDSSFSVKAVVVETLKILLNSLCEVSSQKSLFAIIKCTLALLIDDDFDVRKQTSAVVSELLRLSDVFVGPYAQEVFLRHLLGQSTIDGDKVIAAIIILMYEEEEAESEKEKSNQIACEFQVFEKNETSSFRESFAMRKLCLPLLRAALPPHGDATEYLNRISAVCTSPIESSSREGVIERVEKFLARTFVKI